MKFSSITCSENFELHLHSFDYLSQYIGTKMSDELSGELAKSLVNYKLKTINFNNIYIFLQFLEKQFNST